MGQLQSRFRKLCEYPTTKWLRSPAVRKKIIDAGLVVVYKDHIARDSGSVDTYVKLISPFKLQGFVKDNEFSGEDRCVSMKPFGFGNIFLNATVSALQINIKSLAFPRRAGIAPVFLNDAKIHFELFDIWKPNRIMDGPETFGVIFDANDMRKWSIKQLDLANKEFREATNRTKEIFK